ncbi:serpin-Z1-like [Prosopis cineraria]|uniref:serpin-Z1-like n=1 Tax=Prosopis cineraria TaxID=364024 RepID=UPI00240ED6FD|nr:serpin-Z1-like [Prosopis cineraria]
MTNLIHQKFKDYDFHLGCGNIVKAPFMTSKKDQDIKVCDGFKVLGLSYRRSEIISVGSPCMCFFQIMYIDDLLSLDEKIGSQSGFLEPTSSNPRREATEVADSIIDGENLYVSSMFQKAFIEVNEGATKAGAATAMACASCAANFKPPPKLHFVADHPFLFLVREQRTRALLFVGHVLNPLAD